MLARHPDVRVVVTDNSMPGLEGLGVAAAMSRHDRWREIPVVMQSGMVSAEIVLAAMQQGVYHYLAKPYRASMLVGIVQAALSGAQKRRNLRAEVREPSRGLGILDEGRFRFRTLGEARNLAAFVANRCAEPERIVPGLSELLVNAVEHGNLGISYAEKTALVLAGTWEAEVERRLALHEQQDRFADVHVRTVRGELVITITDRGQGFDCSQYLEMSPERATDPNGRGIALARLLSFQNLEYLGAGNEVRCRVTAG